MTILYAGVWDYVIRCRYCGCRVGVPYPSAAYVCSRCWRDFVSRLRHDDVKKKSADPKTRA